MQPSHAALAVAYSKHAHDHGHQEKGAQTPRVSGAVEARPPCRHPDSIEDLVVEKWVDLPTSQSAAQESRNRAFGGSPLKSTRFNPMSPRNRGSKENRKTRSSTSVVALSPHKRDMVRDALLKYRYHFLKSAEGPGSHNLNIPASVLKGVPREVIACLLLKHAHHFKHGRTTYPDSGRSQPSLKLGDREGGALAASTEKDMCDDLEQTQEQLAKTTIEDDGQMTDQ